MRIDPHTRYVFGNTTVCGYAFDVIVDGTKSNSIAWVDSATLRFGQYESFADEITEKSATYIGIYPDAVKPRIEIKTSQLMKSYLRIQV